MRPFPYTLTAMHLVVLALAITWMNARAAGAELSATCPASVPGTVVKPDLAPEGWTVTVSEQLHLSAAGMMAGPPASMTYLMPQKQTRDTQSFAFERGYGERWLWCAYGGAGGVQLARRLADSATACTVTSKTVKQQGIPTFTASVQCK